MNLEERWLEVKIYYERAYKMSFHVKPSDETIEELHKKMNRLGRSLGAFYAGDIGLLHKLERLQGLKIDEDPVKKRGPWD